MVALMIPSADLFAVDPEQAARLVVDGEPGDAWLDAFMDRLGAFRNGGQLANVLEVWGLSQAEFGELLGISRQAVGKWFERLPSDRQLAVGDLAAATDVLVHYVRRERIPAVVRRPAPALGGRSLVDLIATGETQLILAATRQMFDTSQAIA